MVCQQVDSQNSDIPPVQASPEDNVRAQPPPKPAFQDKAEGNERIQSNLQSEFDGDPVLTGAEVETQVDDESITLTGTVQSYLQHQRVLQLASAYDSYRKIVDNVTVE